MRTGGIVISLRGQQREKRLGCREMREESATAEALTESSPKHLSIKFLGCLLGFADLRKAGNTPKAKDR